MKQIAMVAAIISAFAFVGVIVGGVFKPAVYSLASVR